MTVTGLPLLARHRRTLERLAPGFDRALMEIPAARRESPDGSAITCFRHLGPVALLVPAAAGGRGASALEAVQVQVALGARSPSLAVATTMHQFSVASLQALAAAGGGAEGLLLRAIAEQRLLLASGFAEGQAGRGILESGLTVRTVDGGVRLTGSKKPCSLAHAMDLLTASFVRPTPEGEELIVALVPAQTPGLSRHPFWANPALAGAQSDEVRLDDVLVPDRLLFCAGLRHRLDTVQVLGFLWFELLMSASYLGACAGLVEPVVSRERWGDADRVAVCGPLQLGLAALEGIARELDEWTCQATASDGPEASPTLDDLLARLLLLRYELERLIGQAAALAHEMLGGLSFIARKDSALAMLACHGLRFHPPARIAMAGPLADYLRRGAFSMSSPSATEPRP